MGSFLDSASTPFNLPKIDALDIYNDIIINEVVLIRSKSNCVLHFLPREDLPENRIKPLETSSAIFTSALPLLALSLIWSVKLSHTQLLHSHLKLTSLLTLPSYLYPDFLRTWPTSTAWWAGFTDTTLMDTCKMDISKNYSLLLVELLYVQGITHEKTLLRRLETVLPTLWHFQISVFCFHGKWPRLLFREPLSYGIQAPTQNIVQMELLCPWDSERQWVVHSVSLEHVAWRNFASS